MEICLPSKTFSLKNNSVCVREREKERNRDRDKETERERDGKKGI